MEVSGPQGRLQPREQLAAEDGRELSDGNQEVRLAGDPSLSVLAEPSSGDDAVDVRVEEELLVPRVKHGGESRCGTQLSAADLEHGLDDGLEEEVIGLARIAEKQRMQRVGHGEDQVEVGNGQEVAHLSFDPASPVQVLALGAVAVATRVVDGDLVPAVSTQVQPPAERGGPTAGDRTQDSPTRPVQTFDGWRETTQNGGQIQTGASPAGALAVSHAATSMPARLAFPLQLIQGTLRLTKVVPSHVQVALGRAQAPVSQQGLDPT